MTISSTAGIFSALEVAGSGLTAERSRMNVIASNLANARTTRGADGEVYRRLDPVFESRTMNPSSFDPVLRSVRSVNVREVVADQEPGQLVYDPEHPDADGTGYVELPNVNVVTKWSTSRLPACLTGVTSIESIKGMAPAALRIER